MGKWLKNQKFKGDSRRWAIYEISREGERPVGKLAEGTGFVEVFKNKKGEWTHDIWSRGSAPKSSGWLRVSSRRRLKKVM